ncbi:hypothetical protein F2Q69_00016871 [Brassica cretica]|uniref:Uncharacterized protein n=1 Tax=Brassica cretica TaxID=69181 RepID=A0A8S9QPB7_BRACR|nr:hypothetical protein F2Q69_00016871 [Brassica cretica]
MSIDTKGGTSIDGIRRAPTDTSCPASIGTFYGINCIMQDSKNHDSRGVHSSTPHPPQPYRVTTEDIDRQHQLVID